MFVSAVKSKPLDQRPGRPAVVMGLSPPGLALARSLGRGGVDVIGVSAASDSPAAHSRLFSFRAGPNVDDDEALPFYLDLARELGGRVVLLPTGDRSVLFISRHREELEPHFHYLLPAAGAIERITSKRRFAELAGELDLPTPRTFLPSSFAELRNAVAHLRFPCVVKPEFTHAWRTPRARAAGFGKTKAVPLADADELVSRYEELANLGGALVVQEMVVGPDENHIDYHALVDRSGRLRGEFAGRKIRLSPPHFGVGSHVESIEPGEVAPIGRLVLERLGFRGMANMNFKRDERDGRLRLLELNPRFSHWTGLDIACGVDFAHLYYMACTDTPYDGPSSYRTGKRWVELATDYASTKVYVSEGSSTWRHWLWSIARTSSWSVFAPTDPKPAWVDLRRKLRAALRRQFRAAA